MSAWTLFGNDPTGADVAATLAAAASDDSALGKCPACGGIGGHTSVCTAVVASLDNTPTSERWLGRVVPLHGRGADAAAEDARRSAVDRGVRGRPHTTHRSSILTRIADLIDAKAFHGGRVDESVPTTATAAARNLSLLPEALLLHIFKMVGFDGLRALSLSCLYFSRIVRDPSLWRNLNLAAFQISDEILVELCGRSASIETLNVCNDGSGGVTDVGMAHIATQHTLRELSLQNCRQVTDASLVDVVTRCRRLRRVNMKNCRKVSDGFLSAMGAHCPDLVELNIMGCKKLTNRGLLGLSKLHKLVSLNLWGGADYTPSSIAHILVGNKQLAELELRFCKLVDDGMIEVLVNSCPEIVRLGMAYCENITDRSLHLLLRCEKLAWLNVRDCRHLTKEAMAIFVARRPLCQFLVDKSQGT